MPLSIYDYLEDFDNDELEEDEWEEVMKDKIRDYNDEYQTSFAPHSTLKIYVRWKNQKYQPEQ